MLSAVATRRRSVDFASNILVEAFLCKLIACSVVLKSQPFSSNGDFSIKLPLLEPEQFQSLAPPVACSCGVRPGSSSRLASHSTGPQGSRPAISSQRVVALKPLHSRGFQGRGASPVPRGTRGADPRPKPAAACLSSAQAQPQCSLRRRGGAPPDCTRSASPDGMLTSSRDAIVPSAASGGHTGSGKRICVLGAGVIGLSSAVRLAEELENVQVSIPVCCPS